MINNGFIKVASASINTKVANTAYNTKEIIEAIEQASKKGASLIVFPELSISAYTCADLFFQQTLIQESLNSLLKIRDISNKFPIGIIVGLPLVINNGLYNCAAFIVNGELLGIVPKTFLPNYNEFYEQRWFTSAAHLLDDRVVIDGKEIPVGTDLIFSHQSIKNFKIGMEICEDLWTPIPPSTFLALNGATIIANPSASNDLVGKSDYRKSIISNQSAKTISSYIYASAGYGESTTDVAYGGHCLIYENGFLLNENQRFQLDSNIIYSDIDLDRLSIDRMKMTTYQDSISKINLPKTREIIFDLNIPKIQLDRTYDPHPFVPSNQQKRNIRCEEIFNIQTTSLAKRLSHIGCKHVVIGISGGLDSTLALLVCVQTFDLLKIDRKNIIAITMPGFGTTDRTYNNALLLTKYLGVTLREISIKEACIEHFKAIDHDINVHDVTYENVQARERTKILMNLSNKEKGIVIGTGDLSELALGWATYNGDHMSMYGVNVSIPKTLVRYLVEWVALEKVDANTKDTLFDILDTPVSPELLPPDASGKISQKTEEVVGPYELHDFFLYHMLRYSFSPKKVYLLAQNAFENIYTDEIILHWLKVFYKRFFSQQFKRSCMPDGPKVGSICLSPRGDLRMPSDASYEIWLDELNQIKK